MLTRSRFARWASIAALVDPLSTSARQQVRPADPWLGDDKLRHFFMSFAAIAYAYGGARLAGFEHDVSLPVAVGFAGAAGIGKEVYDRGRRWRFSYRDLVWDAAGIAVGVALLRNAR